MEGCINPRTYTQSYTPTVVQGELIDPPLSFWYIAVFRNDFALSGKPLIFSLQDEAYFIGGGAAGGLWRHQTWSPSRQLFYILSKINSGKNSKNKQFCA